MGLINYITINYPILLFNLGIIFFVLISKNKNNIKTKIAIASIFVNIVLSIFEYYNYRLGLLDYVNDARKPILFFIYAIYPVSFYLLFAINVEENNKLILYSLVLVAFNFIIYFISLFTDTILFINENNEVIKHLFGYTSLITSIIYLLSYAAYKIINRNKYDRYDMFVFLFSFIILLIALFIENILKTYAISISALSFSIFNIYIFEYIKNTRSQSIENEKMIQDQRTALTISQIQPHFLYNALGTISYICKKDPVQASKALDDFSDYLRANLNSIRQKSNVPFLLELNHVKTYVSLEQLRFEEKLKVIYDIQVTDFLIPSLSIQPIVENAVKHGICEKMSGGTIYIRTIAYENSIKIIIEDDGVGFDENAFKNDGKSHVGIENVKSRLETMCDGKLEIRSKVGRGTIATITIPRRKL